MIPGSNRHGLMLASRNGSPTSAQYVGNVDLATSDTSRAVLQLNFYVSDLAGFDYKVYASRIEFLSDFTGQNGYIVWFDGTASTGWNKLKVPLVALGTQGHPSLSHLVGVRVTIYSRPGTRVKVYFYSLSESVM